jgi:glycosyltransferase involved in cell wall biosynthesis
MKILHISTSDSGGAGLAAIRFHEALLKEKINSSILFLDCTKYNGPNSTIFKRKNQKPLILPKPPSLTLKNYIKEKLFHAFSKEYDKIKKQLNEENLVQQKLDLDSQVKFEVLSSPNSPFDILKSDEYLAADLIHLHWVSGFLDYETFFKYNTKPLFWSLHDEHVLLGAFHFKLDSLRNQKEYGDLDQIYSEIKVKSILNSQSSITFICGADWLMNALNSHVFRKLNREKVFYPVNKTIYRYIDKCNAKTLLNLPKHKPIILFAAGNILNYRKGFDLLLPLISDSDFSDVHFLVMGVLNQEFDLPNVTLLGKISDELLMPIIYSSADYYVLPSRAEGFSYGMSEALCCGTPVIAFDVADHKSFLESNNLGVVATSMDSISLKQAMLSCISGEVKFDNKLIADLSISFLDSNKIAKQLISLYESSL